MLRSGIGSFCPVGSGFCALGGLVRRSVPHVAWLGSRWFQDRFGSSVGMWPEHRCWRSVGVLVGRSPRFLGLGSGLGSDLGCFGGVRWGARCDFGARWGARFGAQ